MIRYMDFKTKGLSSVYVAIVGQWKKKCIQNLKYTAIGVMLNGPMWFIIISHNLCYILFVFTYMHLFSKSDVLIRSKKDEF